MMRRHPLIGFEIVSHIDFLHGAARQVVRSHHERWDGAGYPDRIAGPEIPLAARVFSVADTLDAITTDRPYRQGASMDEARERVSAEAGRQFDPLAVEALGQVDERDLEEIAAL